MMMHTLLITLIAAFLGLGQTQSAASGDPEAAAEATMGDRTLTISQQFRVMSEDSLGCVDALRSVELKPDSIFLPQDLRCTEMTGKLKRVASNKRERAVAISLISLQGWVEICHSYGVEHTGNFSDCLDRTVKKRKVIIDAAALTN